MPYICGLSPKDRVRYGISSVIALGIASVILWGLVSIKEPEAKLTVLKLSNTLSGLEFYVEYDLINRNLFRGFNYTNGWIEFFYQSEHEGFELTYDYIVPQYQGKKRSLHLNHTINSLSTFTSLFTSTKELDWDTYTPLLLSNEGHIYVSLYLAFSYKILFWTTETTYYQWLNADAYLNSTFNLKEVTPFTPTMNFTLAIST